MSTHSSAILEQFTDHSKVLLGYNSRGRLGGNDADL